MIRDDYPILESILNKAISSISYSELNQIITKWDNVQFQKTIDYEIFIKIFLVVLLILLAFVYRTYTLKNLNKILVNKVAEKNKTTKTNE